MPTMLQEIGYQDTENVRDEVLFISIPFNGNTKKSIKKTLQINLEIGKTNHPDYNIKNTRLLKSLLRGHSRFCLGNDERNRSAVHLPLRGIANAYHPWDSALGEKKPRTISYTLPYYTALRGHWPSQWRDLIRSYHLVWGTILFFIVRDNCWLFWTFGCLEYTHTCGFCLLWNVLVWYITSFLFSVTISSCLFLSTWYSVYDWLLVEQVVYIFAFLRYGLTVCSSVDPDSESTISIQFVFVHWWLLSIVCYC